MIIDNDVDDDDDDEDDDDDDDDEPSVPLEQYRAWLGELSQIFLVIIMSQCSISCWSNPHFFSFLSCFR